MSYYLYIYTSFFCFFIVSWRVLREIENTDFENYEIQIRAHFFLFLLFFYHQDDDDNDDDDDDDDE
jgi:hypothetical protein